MKLYIKANSSSDRYRTVHVTEGCLYEVQAMQQSLEHSGNTKEFMITNVNGDTMWHHQDWFLGEDEEIQYVLK